MTCYHPLRAWHLPGAKPIFSPAKGRKVIELPCGKCIGCKIKYSKTWAIRCMHEAQLHQENAYLTLTYNNNTLPKDLSLQKRDFVLFMKRIRKNTGLPLRFYMCGEYGEKYSRPHYHAIIFGYYPKDRKYYRTTGAGFKIYTSAELDKLWKNGTVYIGDVTYESAAYIARYVFKKIGGGKEREILDVTTGEIIKRQHEYGNMSLKPAIGRQWYEKFKTDIYPHDRAIMKGKKNTVPRYYDKLLEMTEPDLYATIKEKRATKQAKRELEMEALEGFDWQRLDVHEAVQLAALKQLKRGD